MNESSVKMFISTMTSFQTAFLVFAVFLTSTALELPQYFNRCSKKDPDVNNCILRNAKEAIPFLLKGDEKYEIPTLEPLKMDDLKIHDLGLEMSGYDVYASGLTKSLINNISIDFDKQNLYLEYVIPEMGLIGKYDMSGKIISLPISGHGDFNASFFDVSIKYTTTYQLTKKEDGNVYIELKDFNMIMKPKDFRCRINNLFNGNKVLGDAMNSFINSSWRIVLDEIGKPVFKAIGLFMYRILKPVFKNIPYNELFSDTD